MPHLSSLLMKTVWRKLKTRDWMSTAQIFKIQSWYVLYTALYLVFSDLRNRKSTPAYQLYGESPRKPYVTYNLFKSQKKILGDCQICRSLLEFLPDSPLKLPESTKYHVLKFPASTIQGGMKEILDIRRTHTHTLWSCCLTLGPVM